PIKLWFDIDLDNMWVNVDLPRITTVQAQSRLEVARLSVQNAGERSRFNPSFKWRKTSDFWRNCVDNYLCIEVELSDDLFTFYTQNTIESPLTIAFEDKGFKNLKPDVAFPHVHSCPARGRCKLFTAQLIDEFGGWHYPHAVRVKKGYLDIDHDDDFIYQLPYQLGTRH